MAIEIPDLKRGDAMTQAKDGKWSALYYVDGKLRRVSLKTTERVYALKARNKFFAQLKKEGAVTKKPRSREDKLADNPDLYVYQRKPFFIKIDGVYVGDADTAKEARKMRDEYIQTQSK